MIRSYKNIHPNLKQEMTKAIHKLINKPHPGFIVKYPLYKDAGIADHELWDWKFYKDLDYTLPEVFKEEHAPDYIMFVHCFQNTQVRECQSFDLYLFDEKDIKNMLTRQTAFTEDEIRYMELDNPEEESW